MQVIAAPDGSPLWTSGVRPGREEDITALRSHAQALPLLAQGLPMETVAHRVGYSSASAFVAAFRRAVGVTPGAYFAG